MFRLPLPDMTISGAGAAQDTHGTTPKNVQSQEGEQSFTNTIFASLDANQNTSVNKSEAQPQISEGLNTRVNTRFSNVASEKLKELTGYSNFNKYLNDLYENATNSFKDINSGKVEIAQNENSESAQTSLDNTVQSNLAQQIAAFNQSAEQQYSAKISEMEQALKADYEQMKQQELEQQQDPENMRQVAQNLMNSPMDSSQLAYNGIHTQPQVKEDGMSLGISGSGVKVSSQQGKNLFNFKAGTDSASVSVTRNNTTIFANATTNPGYTTTLEGGKFKNANFNLGVRTTF